MSRKNFGRNYFVGPPYKQIKATPNAAAYTILCSLMALGLIGLLLCGIKLIWEGRRTFRRSGALMKVMSVDSEQNILNSN